ncbi:MAG: TolC family protein [Candidatus Margulisiibacteriota bacterium]
MKRLLVFLCIFFVYVASAVAEAPLTLDKSIELGLEYNEMVIISQKKVEAAQAKVNQAFSGYLPSVNISANYTRSYSSPMRTSFGGVPVVFGIDEAGTSKGWQAALTQNLFTFGKLENALGMALDNSKSAKEELRKAKQEVIYNAQAAYFGIIKAAKMVDLANESVDMAQAHLDEVNAMLQAGMSTKADYLRSEVSLLNSRQGQIRAKNALEIANAAFNNAIGKDIDTAISIAQSDFDPSAELQVYVFSDILKDAYSFRPDLRQASIAKDIAGKAAGGATAGWLPSVFLQGKYGWTNTDYSVNKINYDSTSWQLLGASSWDIFDGLNSAGKIREANANLDAASYNISLVKKSVELDAKQAYLNFETAKEVIFTARKSIESARENNKIAQLRYKNGLATNIEILDAQNSLTKAEADGLTAQFDLELARSQILKASGVLDIKGAKMEEKKLSLEGKVEFIDLEGGFLGFTDMSGKKYNISGSKADEILKGVKNISEGKKIKVWGYPLKDIVSIRMWGTPIEVDRYEWK